MARKQAATTPSAVEQRSRIARDRWAEQVAAIERERADTPPELTHGLQRTFLAVLDGATPRECAAMYRSLADSFPSFSGFLLSWARTWESMGDAWIHRPAGAKWEPAQLAALAAPARQESSSPRSARHPRICTCDLCMPTIPQVLTPQTRREHRSPHTGATGERT